MVKHRTRGGHARRHGLFASALLLGLGCGGGKGATADAGTGGAPVGGSGAGQDSGGDSGAGGTGGATVLALGEAEPSTIVVDDTYVYWTTTTAVRRMPKEGGAVTTLFSSLDSPDELKADDTSLYWTSIHANQGVMSGAKTGGTITTVAPGTARGLTIDADFAYWIQDGPSDEVMVRLAKMGGGTPATIASQTSFGRAAADDQFLYWAEGHMGRIQRVAKAGGTIVDLRAKDPDTTILATLDAIDIYFVTYGPVAQSSTLQRIAKTGGATTMLASGLDQPSDLAVTADAVYWLAQGDSGPTGALIKLSKTNGSQLSKVASQAPYRLALDAQYVYWTELGDHGFKNGRIVRIAR